MSFTVRKNGVRCSLGLGLLRSLLVRSAPKLRAYPLPVTRLILQHDMAAGRDTFTMPLKRCSKRWFTSTTDV